MVSREISENMPCSDILGIRLHAALQIVIFIAFNKRKSLFFCDFQYNLRAVDETVWSCLTFLLLAQSLASVHTLAKVNLLSE